MAGLAASPGAAEREPAGPVSARGLAALVSSPPAGSTAGVGIPEGPRIRWTQAPELVVLMSVMQYHTGPQAEYAATSETLTGAEADELVAHLTEALGILTNDSFGGFSRVHREVLPAGATARIVRKGQIVVGRFDGIRALRQTIGFGGRVPGRANDISSAAVLLDSDYDRTSEQRRLLRIHELGHALGYDHVDAYPSIMNPRIGTPPTDFDREAARLAFASPQDPSAGTR